MAGKIGDKGIPPYIGWATWNRLTRAMKTFVPPRLDRSYFNSLGFSGTQYSQALGAFSFLNLMDESRRPTEKLRQLVMANDENRKPLLRNILQDSYKSFFENPGPKDATLGDLESFLRTQGAKGVLDKCATFFLSAAKDADIQLSPQLAGEFGRKTGRRVRGRPKAVRKEQELSVKQSAVQATATVMTLPSGDIDLNVVTFLAEMPEEKQDSWIKAYLKFKAASKQNV